MKTASSSSSSRVKEEERSPDGRFIRFNVMIGDGSFKKVFLAYDMETGREVAWNTVDLRRLPNHERRHINMEIQLLQQLHHRHIIKLLQAWELKEKQQICFTTEMATSGTLKQYIQRVNGVKLKVIKNWCRQILRVLEYLHTHNPPILHRDLKCDNIFMNGSTGEIKVGDFGLSSYLRRPKPSLPPPPRLTTSTSTILTPTASPSTVTTAAASLSSTLTPPVATTRRRTCSNMTDDSSTSSSSSGNSSRRGSGILENEVEEEDDETYSMVGTWGFIPPEVFLFDPIRSLSTSSPSTSRSSGSGGGVGYDERIDIYSFGMVVLELCTGGVEYPFSECETFVQFYRLIRAGQYPQLLQRVTEPAVLEFIQTCLRPADIRPTARELLAHPFLNPACADPYMDEKIIMLQNDHDKDDQHEQQQAGNKFTSRHHRDNDAVHHNTSTNKRDDSDDDDDSNHSLNGVNKCNAATPSSPLPQPHCSSSNTNNGKNNCASEESSSTSRKNKTTLRGKVSPNLLSHQQATPSYQQQAPTNPAPSPSPPPPLTTTTTILNRTPTALLSLPPPPIPVSLLSPFSSPSIPASSPSHSRLSHSATIAQLLPRLHALQLNSSTSNGHDPYPDKHHTPAHHAHHHQHHHHASNSKPSPSPSPTVILSSATHTITTTTPMPSPLNNTTINSAAISTPSIPPSSSSPLSSSFSPTSTSEASNAEFHGPTTAAAMIAPPHNQNHNHHHQHASSTSSTPKRRGSIPSSYLTGPARLVSSTAPCSPASSAVFGPAAALLASILAAFPTPVNSTSSASSSSTPASSSAVAPASNEVVEAYVVEFDHSVHHASQQHAASVKPAASPSPSPLSFATTTTPSTKATTTPAPCSSSSSSSSSSLSSSSSSSWVGGQVTVQLVFGDRRRKNVTFDYDSRSDHDTPDSIAAELVRALRLHEDAHKRTSRLISDTLTKALADLVLSPRRRSAATSLSGANTTSSASASCTAGDTSSVSCRRGRTASHPAFLSGACNICEDKVSQ